MPKAAYNDSTKKTVKTNIIMSNQLQDILIRHWLFGVLPGRVIADLSFQFSSQRYSKNQYVFHQEDLADRLYVVLEGEVSIETMNLDGKVTKISLLKENELFGELALIDGKGRSASAQVTRSSIIASLNGQSFCKLLELHPSFSKQLMLVLVERLRNTNHQVESLVTMTLLQRTARLLLQISGEHGTEIRTTQSELAQRLYATREKVNTKLKHLERLGSIKIGHGKILIKDASKLSDQLEML